MLLTLRQTIKEHLEANAAKYFFLLLCWAIGIVAGTLFVGMLAPGKAEELVATMDHFCRETAIGNLSGAYVFRSSTMQYAKSTLLLLIASLSLYLTPVIFIHIGGKGFATGFAVCFLTQTYGFKGALLTSILLAPQLLLGLPVLLLFSTLCLNKALDAKKSMRIRPVSKDRFPHAPQFTYSVLLLCVLLLLTAAIDALLSPVFSKLICGFIAA